MDRGAIPGSGGGRSRTFIPCRKKKPQTPGRRRPRDLPTLPGAPGQLQAAAGGHRAREGQDKMRDSVPSPATPSCSLLWMNASRRCVRVRQNSAQGRERRGGSHLQNLQCFHPWHGGDGVGERKGVWHVTSLYHCLGSRLVIRHLP